MNGPDELCINNWMDGPCLPTHVIIFTLSAGHAQEKMVPSVRFEEQDEGPRGERTTKLMPVYVHISWCTCPSCLHGYTLAKLVWNTWLHWSPSPECMCQHFTTWSNIHLHEGLNYKLKGKSYNEWAHKKLFSKSKRTLWSRVRITFCCVRERVCMRANVVWVNVID